jgi:hypothetical protein
MGLIINKPLEDLSFSGLLEHLNIPVRPMAAISVCILAGRWSGGGGSSCTHPTGSRAGRTRRPWPCQGALE